MTAWSDVISRAQVLIDDVRLENQLATSPAQYFRRMSLFIQTAMPLLSRPPELLKYIQGTMTAPLYDDYEWTSTRESVEGEETIVETGKIGFDLCSIVTVHTDGAGVPYYTPYSGAEYDPESGTVNFPRQDRDGIAYMMDFYTDGVFPDLTDAQMRLFALAVAVIWDERFERTFLNLQPKLHDQSFETVNEANFLDKNGQRLMRNRQSFNDELRKYEQDCAFASNVPGMTRRVNLI